MLAALDRLGVEHRALRCGDRGAAVPPAGMTLIVHANAPHMAAALLGLPRGVLKGRRVIGYWAWDLPIAPPAWRIGRRFVHEVWVPSRFTEAALASVLEGVPVRRVPHPVAAAPIARAPLGRADFALPQQAVVVLVICSLASSFVRKNPLAAVAAFRSAFGDRTDRQLVLKLGDTHHFPGDFATLRAAVGGQANIRIDTRALPSPDLAALTGCADIVLSLHRAEGFGLVPAQAMLLGVPVIATGWSGNMDYMDAQSAALVGYRLVPAADPRGVFECAGACWAEPSQHDAVAHLRRLADDVSCRQALGQAGQAKVRATLGADALCAALDSLGRA